MFWSASGAITDLAILVTPMGWEPEKPPPPDTTLRASHVASATLKCSEEGSSAKRQRRRTEVCFRGRESQVHHLVHMWLAETSVQGRTWAHASSKPPGLPVLLHRLVLCRFSDTLIASTSTAGFIQIFKDTTGNYMSLSDSLGCQWPALLTSPCGNSLRSLT